jgi:hypothetical protein
MIFLILFEIQTNFLVTLYRSDLTEKLKRSYQFSRQNSCKVSSNCVVRFSCIDLTGKKLVLAALIDEKNKRTETYRDFKSKQLRPTLHKIRNQNEILKLTLT